MCKECDNPTLNPLNQKFPVGAVCTNCNQPLPKEPANPKMQSLIDTSHRSEIQYQAAVENLNEAYRHRREAEEYMNKCNRELASYKDDLERRQCASHTADFLEKEAKKLREHPETYEDAKWSQEYPATVKEHQDGCCVGHTIERNDPCTTTIKITTWPQRKVAKEGESK